MMKIPIISDLDNDIPISSLFGPIASVLHSDQIFSQGLPTNIIIEQPGTLIEQSKHSLK